MTPRESVMPTNVTRKRANVDSESDSALGSRAAWRQKTDECESLESFACYTRANCGFTIFVRADSAASFRHASSIMLINLFERCPRVRRMNRATLRRCTSRALLRWK